MQNRIQFIDIAKGISILLVILGHIDGLPNIIFKYIYSFHMPAFFFFSGFLFNIKHLDKSFFAFLRKKWNRLIIPYFSMALICYVLFILYPVLAGHEKINNWYFLKPIIGIIYSRGLITWLPNCTPLWFLTCLFMTELLFYQILKQSKNSTFFILLIVICGFLGYLTVSLTPHKLPWNIDTALIAICFYAIGFMSRKYNLVYIMRDKSYLLLPIALAVNYLSVKYNSVVNMNLNKYSDMTLFYIGAISGIVYIILISNWLKISTMFCFFARNTMPIIGFNYASNTWANKTINIFGIIDEWTIKFLLSLVYLMLLSLCLEKIKDKYPIINKFIYGKAIEVK